MPTSTADAGRFDNRARNAAMRKIVTAAVLIAAMTSWSCQSQIDEIIKSIQSVDILKSAPSVAAGRAAYREKDYRTALSEWTPLAEQGNASAQYYLAIMYHKGRGVPRDDAEAHRWYRRAASQDHQRAQYNLGIMYAKGQGVSRDYVKAANWYRKAARLGYAKAQYNLGLMHLRGRGGARNPALTYKWLSLAAARLPEGKYRDDAARLLDDLGSRISPAQRARGRRLARHWRTAHDGR